MITKLTLQSWGYLLTIHFSVFCPSQNNSQWAMTKYYKIMKSMETSGVTKIAGERGVWGTTNEHKIFLIC